MSEKHKKHQHEYKHIYFEELKKSMSSLQESCFLVLFLFFRRFWLLRPGMGWFCKLLVKAQERAHGPSTQNLDLGPTAWASSPGYPKTYKTNPTRAEGAKTIKNKNKLFLKIGNKPLQVFKKMGFWFCLFFLGFWLIWPRGQLVSMVSAAREPGQEPWTQSPGARPWPKCAEPGLRTYGWGNQAARATQKPTKPTHPGPKEQKQLKNQNQRDIPGRVQAAQKPSHPVAGPLVGPQAPARVPPRWRHTRANPMACASE
jgi:hypothetical protein